MSGLAGGLSGLVAATWCRQGADVRKSGRPGDRATTVSALVINLKAAPGIRSLPAILAPAGR
jgi:hypothetical protein